MLVNGALADLNLAIVGSRSKHLTVPAEAEAQHSSLHQHKVVLGMCKEGWGERKRYTLSYSHLHTHPHTLTPHTHTPVPDT